MYKLYLKDLSFSEEDGTLDVTEDGELHTVVERDDCRNLYERMKVYFQGEK